MVVKRLTLTGTTLFPRFNLLAGDSPTNENRAIDATGKRGIQ